jgi:hypothetical protein
VNTSEYLKTLDRELRFKELSRLFADEPLAALIKTLPLKYQNNEGFKLLIEHSIVKKFNFFEIKKNTSLFTNERDFIFDQRSGYAVFNLGGQHGSIMSLLFILRNPEYKVFKKHGFLEQILNIKKRSDVFNVYSEITDFYNTLAEKYLTSGDGFFMSSVQTGKENPMITMSGNFKLKEPFPSRNFTKDFID